MGKVKGEKEMRMGNRKYSWELGTGKENRKW